MMRRTIAATIVALLTAPAAAQEAAEPTPSIQVVGVASVSTKPDIANLVYWVTGEGKTADEASAALAGKQKAIVGGLRGLLGPDAILASGEISVMETRGPQCDGPGNPNNRPRLSEGACTLTGYLATLQGTGRTGAVDKAGTAAALAARLGARDARVQSFQLADPAAAQRRAAAAAIRDARVKAEAMAEGAGVRLGRLIALNDQNSGYDVSYLVANSRASAPPPPPPSLPLVEIDVTPRPLETQARVFARYAIAD
ncbi:SIMPL domain-containing protein [Sphingosinicella sp. BN140058]|uniref:SIMPL domain-containing protein n=1 Tax=Sphingosinicella sp. BN140058 TaxID=1892855 RepID=UPI001011C363|nr:SIMPL domain-containing protein [Sphingosinicella sp. BN140058]QAY76467.1 DUF541 domain-containing protein [Sphingosinicella sp. BN140058]